MTVALSRFGSTSGVAPEPSWRARYVAASVRWKRLEMRLRQSSTVMRAMRVCSFVSDDLAQLALGGFEVFVNYTVFELVDVSQFLARVREAALDHALGVLPAAAQAALELLEGGWH